MKVTTFISCQPAPSRVIMIYDMVLPASRTGAFEEPAIESGSRKPPETFAAAEDEQQINKDDGHQWVNCVCNCISNYQTN